ncbi:type VI secretion system baseplate subunit TssF [Aquabacterium sp. A7-Y]|uniref:type VI secretion system baseplate subunit TssF n=1 Tax=Aquabacterium sp. A7-Y TaxID=1349605 RepID=UPI00223CC39C|nr:type VI secretion system baseplate subunit TssF [Aquabacterium sp. A7-Y]MCW7539698.1 type VI secretion system baseplate subunit TssF [Aquabacterium sp. A7-Y]
MDPRLLQYYNQELRYLRDLGDEFAQVHPKAAGRLGLGGVPGQDPYVERLLEGCAFLAARVQLKLDAEFPRLSHRLLDMVYPGFNAPIPAMLVAQVDPLPDPHLLAGHRLPRGSALYGPVMPVSANRCEFRTAQDTLLTPVEVSGARQTLDLSGFDLSRLPPGLRPRAALVLELRLPEGMRFEQLEPDRLRFFLTGSAEVAACLIELCLTAVIGLMAGPPGGVRLCPHATVSPVGYRDEDAMLPTPAQGFAGLRVLQETLTFPERFQFVDIDGLRPAFAGTPGASLELVLLLSRPEDVLAGAIGPANFRLNCVPAINLFPRRADRVQAGPDRHEFHVVADRTAPLDHEVYDVTAMTGFDASGQAQRFTPLYGTTHHGSAPQRQAYTLRREARLASERSRREGPRSAYLGSEVYIAWSDADTAPAGLDLDQVALQLLCTNRDLPLFLRALTELPLELDAGIGLRSVRAVAGPSRPWPAPPESAAAWRLLNLLSLNYLSLIDAEAGDAAGALRELLLQLPQAQDEAVVRQIEAIRAVRASAVHRRHPTPGPIVYSRGVEVRLELDERSQSGYSAFLLGAALHHYLARHVSINSFVETVLVSLSRGEVARWRPLTGARAVL